MDQITSTALLELSLELAACITSDDKFNHFLSTIRQTIRCESVAVLVFKGDHLVPLAMQGLSKETLGRRFYLEQHPRFEQICHSSQAVRFPANCDLPDPYDGLLLDRDGDLPVHACMGLPLHYNAQLIGVLTLDSLTPHVFDDISERTLELIASMASVSLNAALTIATLEQRVQHSNQVVAAISEINTLTSKHELIGQSDAMLRLRKEINLVAPSDFTVLIQGETGTGKELVAHNLHMASHRNQAPIIYVNCAALPENLIESELFGHAKGAFTGADKARAGKFVIADGGTLFLDEIGELPLAAQSKLLRALQSNEIQAVGQDRSVRVDVRVVAATNRSLEDEVAQGRFRADLFHRLNVYPLNVPPLKQRLGDIELLAGFFLERLSRKLGLQQLTLAPLALSRLTEYDWPGNVRELEHVIGRAALKASARQRARKVTKIELSDFDNLSIVASNVQAHEEPIEGREVINLKQQVEQFQARLIRSTLQQEQGNWAATARRLQMDRANLNRLAKRLGIQVKKQVI